MLDLLLQNQCRLPKPWKKTTRFFKEDVIGNLQIVLGDGVYVDTLNLMPRLQNQIRSLAAFDNPVFYKNKKLGYSNYYNFSSVYLGKDVDGYIRIPRGLLETLTASCEDASIPYEISDQREKGRPIRVSFNGDLRLQQDLAAQSLLSHDNGVLSAATAFGKTVVCSYLIAQRKVNTLILLQSKDLQQQWIEELEKFLTIDEEPPTYTTKTGRVKRREGVIGMISSTKKAPTGIVDVALVGSVYSKGRFNDLINSYGMIILIRTFPSLIICIRSDCGHIRESAFRSCPVLICKSSLSTRFSTPATIWMCSSGISSSPKKLLSSPARN